MAIPYDEILGDDNLYRRNVVSALVDEFRIRNREIVYEIRIRIPGFRIRVEKFVYEISIRIRISSPILIRIHSCTTFRRGGDTI